MQPFMKAISVPVADSPFMIESVILYWTTNMVTDHSKEYYI